MHIFFLYTMMQMLIASSNYQATYELTYCPDSTNLKRKSTENFFLYLEDNRESFFASENSLKRDSLRRLVKEGVLSPHDLIGNGRNSFFTRFNYFIYKNYPLKKVDMYETIAIEQYKFPVEVQLKWIIENIHDTITGYPCIRATTTYAGRNYEAWFTPEIPVSDGPYIFSGLPGLIIKLQDTRGHYIFVLKKFEVYSGKIIHQPTYNGAKGTIETNRNKAFIIREESRRDPIGYLNRIVGASSSDITFTPSGASQSVPAVLAVDRSWDNNPLELK